MAISNAETVEGYLAELPVDRRSICSAVREKILRALPEGYTEQVRWGMIAYEVPLERYPKTYNGQPLCYAALAAQKNYFSLYLMGVYGDPDAEARLRGAFEKAGKKLDMGKSCVRFRAIDDLPLDVIEELIASVPVETYIAKYEASRSRTTRG